MARNIVTVLLFVWGILIGLAMGGLIITEGGAIVPPLSLSGGEPQTIIVPVPYNFTNLSTATILVPAVSQDGEGVSTSLTVQMIPGNGRILANIDNILFLMDTQNSIRTAKGVAQSITGTDLKNFDTIYTINAKASVIEGPSAGAAIAIATIAAIENKEINENVIITGTVDSNGIIGPVGGILEKAKASRDVGATLFLVPKSQGTSVSFETRRYCENIGGNEVCTVEQVPVEAEISTKAGIEIIEVGTVEEALKYFLD